MSLIQNMYSISGYGKMIIDSVRMDAYSQALRRSITPNSIVLDIGTGTGIFAMLACQLGARRVYAIETSDAIQVARELAKVNCFDDRIEFIQDLSTAVTLPERADVVISDLRGALPLYQSHIASIADARQRFLAPGGRLIAQSDSLWVALVETPEAYRDFEAPWLENPYGFDLRVAQRYPVNKVCKALITVEQLLVPPSCWAKIDYATIENPNFHAELAWTVTRSGTAHGLSAWFDAAVMETIGFSNAPGQPSTVYGQSFFPLFRPVQVNEGDQVSLKFAANLVNGNYIWRWNTCIVDRLNPEIVKADFKQSNFFSEPLSMDQLHKRTSRFTPSLRTEGQLQKLILSLMDGTLTLEEISRQISQQYPERYADWQEALPEIGELSRKYSR